MANLTGWHLVIILAVVLLIFGATRLPALAKGVGQSMRIFKNEIGQKDDDGVDASKADATVPQERAVAHHTDRV